MHNKANGHEAIPLLIPSGLKRERMSLNKKMIWASGIKKG